jgi:hypothetical protein
VVWGEALGALRTALCPRSKNNFSSRSFFGFFLPAPIPVSSRARHPDGRRPCGGKRPIYFLQLAIAIAFIWNWVLKTN